MACSFRYALHVADSSFAAFDALIEPDRAQPTSPLKTGSAASLVGWEELGRAGREFIATGPTAAEISAFTQTNALEPIRVYVGLRAADTAEERAQLALEELNRVGGFRALRARRHHADRHRLGRSRLDGHARISRTMATWRASPCSIPICRARCRCWSSRTTARRRPGLCLPRSMNTGRRFRRTSGRNSICTASASAR